MMIDPIITDKNCHLQASQTDETKMILEKLLGMFFNLSKYHTKFDSPIIKGEQ